MPWDKKKVEGQICVYKKTTGKVLHCYSGAGAESKADAYLRALHANMPAGEKEDDFAVFEVTKEDLAEVEFKAGNIAGLSKHLSKKYGGDPHFFSKCMATEELADYDTEARSAICAKAHHLATGIWPGSHGGANPNANEPAKKKELHLSFNPDLMKEIKGKIVIDNEEDDDWMKSLPGYKDEVAIHEQLAIAHAAGGVAKLVTKELKKEIIAARGANIFLVAVGETKAVIVNKQTKDVSKPMHKDAYLKFGYWEAYKGEQDADVLGLV